MPFDDKIELIARLKPEHPTNIALQSFDPTYFETLEPDGQNRLMACLNSGIENPTSEMGCYACQPSDYDDFRPFFARALAAYHKVPEDARHENNWSLEGLEEMPDSGVLDLAAIGLPALSMVLTSKSSFRSSRVISAVFGSSQ